MHIKLTVWTVDQGKRWFSLKAELFNAELTFRATGTNWEKYLEALGLSEVAMELTAQADQAFREANANVDPEVIDPEGPAAGTATREVQVHEESWTNFLMLLQANCSGQSGWQICVRMHPTSFRPQKPD